MTIIGNGKRYVQTKYATEKDFEEDVVASSKLLFGKSTIYINAKKKIDSKSLGGAIPDGFFFDFGDASDPQFYIVEVELSSYLKTHESGTESENHLKTQLGARFISRRRYHSKAHAN